MEEIIIYGSDCRGCQTLQNNVETIVKKFNLNVNITKKTNLEEAFKIGITKLPGLVIDGQIISYGVVLDEEMLEEIFEELINESN